MATHSQAKYRPMTPPDHEHVFRTKAVGTSFRIQDAKRFARGTEHQLRLVAEPSNPADPNAIAVYGSSRGILRHSRWLHVGYLPKGDSEQIADDEIRPSTLVALPRYVRAGVIEEFGKEFATIEMQVYVPKAELVRIAEQEAERIRAGERAAAAAADREAIRQAARDRRADLLASGPEKAIAAWRSVGRRGHAIVATGLLTAGIVAWLTWLVLDATGGG